MRKCSKKSEDGSISLFCQSSEKSVVREFMSKIGDKWSILIIVVLAKSETQCLRFSEFQKLIDGISQRMLTTTLRNLERDGLVTRKVYPQVPPRVEYELTPLGLGLLEPMEMFVEWIGTNWPKIKKARESFDIKARK